VEDRLKTVVAVVALDIYGTLDSSWSYETLVYCIVLFPPPILNLSLSLSYHPDIRLFLKYCSAINLAFLSVFHHNIKGIFADLSLDAFLEAVALTLLFLEEEKRRRNHTDHNIH
jgi:hypothetical protein